MVVARGVLKLRGGPGTNFDSEKTLPAGTELNAVDSDGQIDHGCAWIWRETVFLTAMSLRVFSHQSDSM